MPHPSIKTRTMTPNTISLFALVLLFTMPSDAFFRNRMIGALGMGRVDPIVNPGAPSYHCHHLNGGQTLNLNSTGAELSESTCTTSTVTRDKSAYWAPWLYFQHDNGDFEPVNLTQGLIAYYKLEKRPDVGDASFEVFPKNFRMVAGDSKKRNWVGNWPTPPTSSWTSKDTTQEALMEKSLGFNCLNYASHNEPSFAYPYLRSKDFIDNNCPDGLRAEVLFPSCWDGKNLDSADHQSHVAYPPLLQDGTCPDTHPVYLPILFYETIWNTAQYKDIPGQFVLANGDPTGYGYHGDFLASWDDGVLQDVMNDPTCTSQDPYHPNPDITGQVELCDTFKGYIQSDEDADACKMTLPEVLSTDVVTGIIPFLPGHVKVTGTRCSPGDTCASDDSGDSGDTSNVTATSSAWDNVQTPTSLASNMFNLGTQKAYAATTQAPPPPSACAAVQNNAVTTTYTSAGTVVEMILYETYETTTITVIPTETVTAQTHTKAKRHLRDHIHAHEKRHRHGLAHDHM